MLDAEQVALDSGIPATRVRLAGIYGPGREWLLNQVRQGYRVVSEPPLYANRIHADDAAGLLAFLLRADAGGQALEDCYIGVDDAPVAMHEVVDYLRQRLGVSQWADEHSVRRAGGKRCSNRRARALGWVPRYPSYREGYGGARGRLMAANRLLARPGCLAWSCSMRTSPARRSAATAIRPSPSARSSTASAATSAAGGAMRCRPAPCR